MCSKRERQFLYTFAFIYKRMRVIPLRLYLRIACICLYFFLGPSPALWSSPLNFHADHHPHPPTITLTSTDVNDLALDAGKPLPLRRSSPPQFVQGYRTQLLDTTGTPNDIDENDEARNAKLMVEYAPQPQSRDRDPLEGTLFVSTLDGQLHGIRAADGEHLWSFGTDEPVLRSSMAQPGLREIVQRRKERRERRARRERRLGLSRGDADTLPIPGDLGDQGRRGHRGRDDSDVGMDVESRGEVGAGAGVDIDGLHIHDDDDDYFYRDYGLLDDTESEEEGKAGDDRFDFSEFYSDFLEDIDAYASSSISSPPSSSSSSSLASSSLAGVGDHAGPSSGSAGEQQDSNSLVFPGVDGSLYFAGISGMCMCACV